MSERAPSLPFSRWWLVAVGALGMGMAGTYQFVWSSIRGPLGERILASDATLGTLFTLLVVAQTLSQFPFGRLRDRRGPRLPAFLGGLLVAVGYVGLAVAPSPAVAAVAVVVGGAGAGALYTVAVNTPVKWFRERRGLATGVVSTAYGGVSVLLIPVVRGGGVGFTPTMLAFAGGGAVACAVGAAVLRDPAPAGEVGADGEDDRAGDDEATGDDDEAHERAGDGAGGPHYTWREAAHTWQFWLLYGALVLVNGVGLMLIGTAVAFAEGLGLSAVVATAAASAVALSDGAGLVVVGGASDRFGSVRTAGVSLLASAVALAVAVVSGAGGIGWIFLLGVGAAAFFRSPVFSIFPALVGTYYGTRHSSENYAALYTAKLWGGVFGGAVTSLLVARLGWERSFLLGAALLAVAGVATLFVRPVEGTGPRRAADAAGDA